MTEPLTREIETYAREKARLEVEHGGRFVLVHGDAVAGVFDTVQDAATEGLRRFGAEPFLVRRVGEDQVRLSVAVLYGSMHAGDPIHLSIP